MKSSQNSLDNLKLATTTKKCCAYCSNNFSLTNIKKHENACKENPRNLKECPSCKKLHSKNGITCSYACSNTYFSHLRNKPEKYNRYRTICFKNHKKECIICGENKIVAVHHMNEDHNDNRPENLIPLCPTHHQYVHSKYKKEIIDKINEYINLRFA